MQLHTKHTMGVTKTSTEAESFLPPIGDQNFAHHTPASGQWKDPLEDRMDAKSIYVYYSVNRKQLYGLYKIALLQIQY